MRIFEFKINWERKWFYKKISLIKDYLKVIFELKNKDIDKLNVFLDLVDISFKEQYILKNWTKVNIEIKSYNLVE